MQPEIPWSDVVSLFHRVTYTSIATVDPDGCPRVSPIGSVLVTGENQGYFFEKFPERMKRNLDQEPRMSIMAVAPGFGFWLGALWRGQFKSHPALRLICEAGARRTATDEERRAWLDKVRRFRRLKGHDMLWKNMRELREFTVVRIEPVALGRMNPS